VPSGADDEKTATLTPLRRHRQGCEVADGGAVATEESVMWFVTVTVSGPPADTDSVRSSLERLSAERPFVVSARYSADRAEVRYWDESDEVEVAVSQALRMWRDHALTARLPRWRVVGVEVVDRETARLRWDKAGEPQVFVLGEIRRMDSCD